MLGILLLILKVIGLLILTVVALFLILICLILFVPICYRVYLSGTPEQEPVYSCRITLFGIQVFPKKRKKRSEKSSSKKEAADKNISDQTAGTEDASHATERTAQSQTTGQPKRIKKNSITGASASDASEQTQRESDNRQEKKFAKGVMDTTKQLWTELTDEHNRSACLHLLQEIRRLLHHIGPRHVKGDMSFSLADPANTGYVTAALSVCPFVYGKKCRITPDFVSEDFYLNGWLNVSGHICVVHVVAGILRLLFDRNVRTVIKKLRR